MFRILSIAIACVGLSLAGLATESSAVTLSRNNPYRSFNISGYNYGSVQWEKSHGNKSSKNWSANRTSGRWFRRR